MAIKETVEEQQRAKKVHDPELKALATIGELLGPLSEEQRGRVLGFVIGKYAPPTFKVEKTGSTA